MPMVPDITAGTGTEFEEMLVCDGSGGLSQSEGQEEYCGNPRPNHTRPLSDKPVFLPRFCRHAPHASSSTPRDCRAKCPKLGPTSRLPTIHPQSCPHHSLPRGICGKWLVMRTSF